MNPSQFNLLNASVTGNTYQPGGNPVPVTPSGQIQAFGQFSQPQAQPNANGTELGAATQGIYDPNAAAAAATKAANDAAVNSAIGRLGIQADTGKQNILGSYNNAYNSLLNNKQAALDTYGQNRNQTVQDNILAKDNIDTGVRNQAQGIQRLLGAHGAGNSSAAQILGPYAAALQGSQQRAQVQNAYGHNLGAIDQSISNYGTEFNNSVGSLNNQRDTQLNSLNQGIASSRGSLLGQRSDAAGNQGQINAILDSAARLGITPQFTPTAINTKAPDLKQYNYDQAAPIQAAQNGIDPNLAQGAGAYWNLLNGSKDKTKVGAV